MLVSSLSVWPRLAYPSWISLWTTESRTLSVFQDGIWTNIEIHSRYISKQQLNYFSFSQYISVLLAFHYRFNKFISVLPDTFLPQSWSRLELAWSSAWWRRPPPPPACWCRCHPSRSNGCPGCPPANRCICICVSVLQVTCCWWDWLNYILYRCDLWHDK